MTLLPVEVVHMAKAVTKVFGRPGPSIKAKYGDYSAYQIKNGESHGVGLTGTELLIDFNTTPNSLVSVNPDTPNPTIKFKFRPGTQTYWVTFLFMMDGIMPKMVNVDGGIIFLPEGFAFSSKKDAFDLVTLVGSSGPSPSFAVIDRGFKIP